MTDEVLLLLEARRRLASDPGGALALLEQHAATFAGGALAMEREVLIIEALERLGRKDEATLRARRLTDASPDALYVERLRPMVHRSNR